MGIKFCLINFNLDYDASMIVQQDLSKAFREYGYTVSDETTEEADIYISSDYVSDEAIKLILTNESDITKDDMSYYENANKYFNVDGDIAAVIISGEITKKTTVSDLNYYFNPLVYVHLLNRADIHMLSSYLIRRYGGVSKLFYEIGEV